VKTKTYRVVWQIDVEATSAKKAAQEAKAIQIDPESTANFFEVYDNQHLDVGCLTVGFTSIDLSAE
jgi:hypothetical protein